MDMEEYQGILPKDYSRTMISIRTGGISYPVSTRWVSTVSPGGQLMPYKSGEVL